MTRPTDEQIKALRKGDVVTLKCMVAVPPISDGTLVAVRLDGGSAGGTDVWAATSDIVSIERRDIKVGDRVTIGAAGCEGTVKNVDGNAAFVAWDQGWHTADLLSNLKVIT